MSLELWITVIISSTTLISFIFLRWKDWGEKKKSIKDQGAADFEYQLLKKNIGNISRNMIKVGSALTKVYKDLNNCFNLLRSVESKNKDHDKKLNLIITEITDLGKMVVTLENKAERIEHLEDILQRHIEKE